MKYTLGTALMNIDGTQIKSADGVVTFKAAAMACLVQCQDEKADDKVAAFSLAVKIECAENGVVELEAEDVARLKRLIGATMPVVIVGRMFQLLDQK